MPAFFIDPDEPHMPYILSFVNRQTTPYPRHRKYFKLNYLDISAITNTERGKLSSALLNGSLAGHKSSDPQETLSDVYGIGGVPVQSGLTTTRPEQFPKSQRKGRFQPPAFSNSWPPAIRHPFAAEHSRRQEQPAIGKDSGEPKIPLKDTILNLRQMINGYRTVV